MRLLVLLALLGLTLPPALLSAQQPTPPKPVPPKSVLVAKGARLRGIVLREDDGSPLPTADVTLVGLDVAVRSGTDGKFDFGVLDAGSYIVQARFLGFKPYTVRAELADSSQLDLVFRLKLQPIQLEEKVVTAKRKENRFTQHMQESNGFGTFVTREQIAERNTPFMCDLLRGRFGLRVIGAGSGCQIRFSRAQVSSDCAPILYLDGVRVDLSLAESNNYPTTNLEGVEIYRSATEAPAEYNMGNACGVVALWTRDGR